MADEPRRAAGSTVRRPPAPLLDKVLMKEIEQHILNYRELSPEEREAVEAYVAEHPEWTSLLREVKGLEALAEEARLFDAPEDAENALAYYVVARHLHPGGLSPALRELFADLEARLDTDAELRARCEAMEARLQEVMDAIDPVAHFEQLTGRQLKNRGSGGANGSADAPDETQTAPDRPPKSSGTSFGVRVKRVSRWVGMAAVALAAFYGVLFTASKLSQSEVEALSFVAMSEMELEGYSVRTRSASPSPEEEAPSTDVLYQRALSALQSAQTSTLGLFPRFDEQELSRAESLLQQVVEQEEENSFLQLEAYFFLGKAHLAQGKVDSARADFKRVVIGEGRRTQDASAILERLQQIAPAEHGATPMFDSKDTLPTG